MDIRVKFSDFNPSVHAVRTSTETMTKTKLNWKQKHFVVKKYHAWRGHSTTRKFINQGSSNHQRQKCHTEQQETIHCAIKFAKFDCVF